MNSSAFKIGDLVSLKSHAYNENLTSIVVSGDHSSLPPIMIVNEIYRVEKRDNNKVLLEEHFHINCIYFSSKSNTLQEVRLRNIYLKKLEDEPGQKSGKLAEMQEGATVLLKSTRLELKKRKSTFSAEEHVLGGENSKSTISALLTYLPPIFHVINIKEFIPKQKSNGLSDDNYWHYSKKVKCFYHNSHNDKISEVEIPYEALEVLQPVSNEILKRINSAILNKKFLIYSDEKERKSILQPQFLSFRSGFYFLKAYNMIDSKIVDINVSDQMAYKDVDKVVEYSSPSNEMPYFNENLLLKDMIEKINIGLRTKQYLRIKYKNKNEEISVRTLSDYSIKENPDDENRSLYLTGYCHLREADRTFNLKRIQMVQVLSLSY